jgi:hypothetical protein
MWAVAAAVATAVVVVEVEVVGAAATVDPDDTPFVPLAVLSPASSGRLLAMQK